MASPVKSRASQVVRQGRCEGCAPPLFNSSPRSVAAKLATAFLLVLVSAVPVFAANLPSGDGNTGGVTAGSVTASKPSGLAAGDVMIASVSVRSNSATTITPVASWNFIAKRITTSGNPDTQLSTYWKTADAADVAAAGFQFNLSPNVVAHAGVARYDDVAVTSGTPIAANVTNPASDGGSQNNPVRALSVTTAAPGSYVHAIYATDDDATLSTPAGMSPVYNNVQTTGEQGRLAAFDLSQASAGVSGNKDSTAGANVAWTSQTLALKPKPTKLGFATTAKTGPVDGCLGPIKVQTQNTSGTAVNPLSDTEVGLATDGAGDFYVNAACDDALDQVDRTIGPTGTEVSFYYKPTARGTGSHTITATATGLTQAQQAQTVKLAQAITWNDVLPASEEYGDSFSIGTPAATPSGLPVTVTPSGGCSLVGSTATMTSGSSSCVLTASQAGDADYAPAADVQRTVTANLRPVTVTVDPNQSKVYNNGASNPTYTFQVTAGSFAFADSLTLTRAPGENVSGSPYAISVGSFPQSANYTLTFVGDSFAITPRPLSMNGNNASKTYGAADPTFTTTLTGFATGHNNRNQAGITGTESCTRSNPLVQGVAVYDDVISCAQGTLTAANGNYSFATGTAGDFTVDPKQLTVDADPATKVYGDADPALTATLNGFAFSETPATANVTGAASCLRTGVGTDEDVGTYNDVLSCTDNTLAAPNYTFAPGAPADFEITKRTAHVTSTVADKTYDRNTSAQILNSVLTNRAPGEGATEIDYTATLSAAFATATAGQDKPVDIADNGTLATSGTKVANYDVVVDDTTADINPLQLAPSFTAASKVYDGTTAATVNGRSVSGVIAPDVVSLTGGTATFASKTVATGKTVTLAGATLSGADAGNYALPAASPTTTADITAKSVSGSFTAASKDFDGNNSATITGRSLSGAVAGDAVALTGGTATFSDANPGVGKTVAGTGFSLGGADAGNYTLASVGTTTATIRQRDPEDTPPGQKSPAENAADLLGGDVKALGLDLGGLGFAFAPKNQGKIKPVNQTLFAIGGCPAGCTIDAAKTLVLTGEAGASAGKTKRIKLKTQKLTLGANQLGLVKLKLTKKQKKAIKKANKAKLVVKVTLNSGAQTVTGKKIYRFKKG